MQQIVTITSQGQITLPASIRRLFKLDKYKKALVKTYSNKIVVEPLDDITNLAGLFKKKALKRKNIEKIIQLEERTVEKMIR
ncbi:MAG: AbrB/MazE/SpoVT family DNA-binding domain-containing protein [Patescibacteria group bacterium]|nr:AbrB/MazE/SpoVT family DNA-binding domain-containing protein [Patescibacteria group bacterium]